MKQQKVYAEELLHVRAKPSEEYGEQRNKNCGKHHNGKIKEAARIKSGSAHGHDGTAKGMVKYMREEGLKLLIEVWYFEKWANPKGLGVKYNLSIIYKRAH